MNMIDTIIKTLNNIEGCTSTCPHCHKMAKLVVQAMLEPTEEMRGPGLLYSNDDVLRYKAVIYSILKE